MKKKMPFLLLLMFISITSCTTTLSSYRKTTSINTASLGNRCLLNVKIFQTFNNHEALALRNDLKDLMVVKLTTNEDTFYDGKIVSDYYIMIDTYSYISKDSTFKTVPVFIKESEYNKNKP